jgi:hypothetical protein
VLLTPTPNPSLDLRRTNPDAVEDVAALVVVELLANHLVLNLQASATPSRRMVRASMEMNAASNMAMETNAI